MKNYIVNMYGSNEIVRASKPTGDWAASVICTAPEGEEIQWLDIVDVIDEITEEIVGKEAVVNQTKKDTELAARLVLVGNSKWDTMRTKRDSLLSECDWVMLTDSPIVDTTAYETYRTELRDLPSTIVDIDSFSYPTKP